MKRIILLLIAVLLIGNGEVIAQLRSLQVSYMPFQYWMYNKTDLNYIELNAPSSVDYQVGGDAAPNGHMISAYLSYDLNEWLKINTGLSWSTQFQSYRSLFYGNYTVSPDQTLRIVGTANNHKSKVNYLHLPIGIQASWNNDFWLSPVIETGVQISYMQDYTETRELLARKLPYDGSFFSYGTETYTKAGKKHIIRDGNGVVTRDISKPSHIYNLWAFGVYFRGGLRKYIGDRHFIELLLRSDYDFTNTDHVENNDTYPELFSQGYKGIGLNSSSEGPRSITHNIRLGFEISYGILF